MKIMNINFSDLNLEEIEHILDIIKSYKEQLEFDKFDKFSSSPAHIEWIDKHIAYHNSIIKKMEIIK